MAEPSACRDLYFRPARKDFNFGNKTKSHGARLEKTGAEEKQLLFLFFKTAETIAEVCHVEVTGRRVL
jgi:hypothetical protein